MSRRTTALLVLGASLVLVACMMVILTRSPFIKSSYADQASLDIAENASLAGFVVEPISQGSFVSPDEVASFQVTIKNTGTAPSDTFEISLNSDWPASLFGPDAQTPLQDTNASGMVDTGPLPSGANFDLHVHLVVSQQAKLGDQSTTTLQISSWMSPEVSAEALIDAAVPAAFAQVLRDGQGAQSLYLVDSNNQTFEQVSATNNDGLNPAIAESNNSYVMVWSRWRMVDNPDIWLSELDYTLTDKIGNTIKPVTRLEDHSGDLPLITHDFRPVVSAVPGGNSAIVWYREILNESNEVNQNIFFAILDKDGKLIHGPSNLTNSDDWGPVDADNVPQFDMPRVTATGDDRFFIAWDYTLGDPEITAVRDIYYEIRESNGAVVTSTVNLTNDLPDTNGDVSPVLASIAGNRVLVAWVHRQTGNDDVFFAVIDSDGNIVEATQNLSTDERVDDWLTLDAQELSNGRIIVAWKAWGCSSTEFAGRIRFATVSNAYRRLGQPKCLTKDDGLAIGGDWGVSLAVDAEDNLSITWTDDWTYLLSTNARPNLYYALLDSNGNVDVKPMIYYRTLDGQSTVSINHEGYGMVSRIFVDSYVSAGPIKNDPQNPKLAEILVRYGNLGTSSTSGLVLTLTLDTNLTYQGSTSLDPNPIITGNQIIWDNLNELAAFETQQFSLYVSLPTNSPPKASYPLTLTLGTNNVEASKDNNEIRIQVSEQNTTVFLPFVVKED